MHPHRDTEITAVHDALTEAAVTLPEIANPHSRFGVSDSALRDAMRFIPDEHHACDFDLGARFVASVIANARAAGRSPYTVALFALDIA